MRYFLECTYYINYAVGQCIGTAEQTREYSEPQVTYMHVLELLNVLLEETCNQSFKLLLEFSQDIRIETILDAMLDFWLSTVCDTCFGVQNRIITKYPCFNLFYILETSAGK